MNQIALYWKLKLKYLWVILELSQHELTFNFFHLGKNTLVIMLQLYRLYVVYSENQKSLSTKKKLKYQQGERRQVTKGNKGQKRHGSDDIYIISNEKSGRSRKRLENIIIFYKAKKKQCCELLCIKTGARITLNLHAIVWLTIY